MTTLPNGWESTTIGELCNLINGKAFKPSDWTEEGLPIVRIQNLNKPDAPYNHFDGEVADKFKIDSGQLLFAWSGTPGTSFGAHVWNGGPAVLNQHIFKVEIEEEDLDKVFFRRSINQTLDELIHKAHGGVGLRHVTKGVFEGTEVPLPPLAEQRRIVAKLDQLSARTRAAKDHLAHVQTLATRAKQATLAAAFRGELTEGFEETQHPSEAFADVGISGQVPELPNLPAGWAWLSVQSIASVTGGLTKNSKRREMPNTAPYLRVANVYANELRLDDIAEIGCTDKERQRTELKAGDLLVVEGNGSQDQIGRVALWNGEVAGCLHQNHLIKVRPEADVSSSYLLYWLLSPVGRTSIEAIASSSSGLHTLSLTKVKGLPVPACSPEEQDEIVRRIETAFARIDRVVAEATRAAELLERLEQQLLAKAFRGELVPQDPADEPASALLARIRETRAAGEKQVPKPKRRAKPAKKEANDAFKRSVLATYIADVQCDHATFGRVKFQKLLHLCEAHLEIQEVAGNYYRDAAGPFDTQMMRSVHSQIKKSGWITMTKREGDKGWTYHRGDKIEGYKDYFDRYFGERKDAINDLLALIGPMNTEQAEIVSTAFAAWNDLLLEGKAPSDDEIVYLILNEWTESKRKIDPERWHLALDWMRKKALVPRGLGEHTKQKR